MPLVNFWKKHHPTLALRSVCLGLGKVRAGGWASGTPSAAGAAVPGAGGRVSKCPKDLEEGSCHLAALATRAAGTERMGRPLSGQLAGQDRRERSLEGVMPALNKAPPKLLTKRRYNQIPADHPLSR